MHCFQLDILRSKINNARIDEKKSSDKCGHKARVVVQREIFENIWPSVLHFNLHVNRNNSAQ